MKLSEKITVPELDELHLARMERSIVAEAAAAHARPVAGTGRLRKGVMAMVAVAGVALAIGLNLRAAQAPVATSELISADATHIVTGSGQSSRLRLGDAVVDVGADTSLSVQRFTDGRIVIQLEAGHIHCEVEPREQRPSFQVASGDVMVRVIGTGFDVARGRTVEVRVQHGIVAVETSDESIRLQAGEEWQGSPRADRSLALLLGDAEAEAQADDPTRAPLEDDGEHGESETDDTSHGKISSNARKARGEGNRGADAGGPIEPVQLADILKGAKPLPPIFKRSHNPELAGLQEVSASNPRAAVKKLEAVAATSTGDDASFALYSRAYLLFFKLHESEAAITAATQYARRFPKGAEAEDMLWLRVRASCDGSRSSACRAAAHTYLRMFPRGIFAGLCARITKTSGTE